MSFANNPTLSEPEPEQHVRLGPRGPRVHFINDATRFPHHSHTHATPISVPHDTGSSNECASPQRFTNPFGREELEPDTSMSGPALDGVTLYQTQLPLNGS